MGIGGVYGCRTGKSSVKGRNVHVFNDGDDFNDGSLTQKFRWRCGSGVEYDMVNLDR